MPRIIEANCAYTGGGECWFVSQRIEIIRTEKRIVSLAEEKEKYSNDAVRVEAINASIAGLERQIVQINRDIDLKSPCKPGCQNK